MFVLDCGRRGKRVGLPLNLDDLFSLIFLFLCISLLFCFVAFSDFLYLVDICLEKWDCTKGILGILRNGLFCDNGYGSNQETGLTL